MQRFVLLPVALALAVAPAVLTGQQAAGAELWRLAGVTVPLPAALSRDGAATFWNPAQETDGARALASLEAIQTSDAIGASGVLAALTLRAAGVGRVGLIYGRMQLGGLVRTSFAPDAVEGTVPFYSHAAGITWTRGFGTTTLGATLEYHSTQLDTATARYWSFDVGAAQRINDVLRIAAATHFFSSFRTADALQDLYGGVEARVYRGPLWDSTAVATVRIRYGVTLTRAGALDHAFGAGVEFGPPLAVDALVVREAGYSGAAWRVVGGLRVGVGRYRISFARDAGVNDVGSAFRVGLEVRVP
jgi:hypothetical protein